MSGKKIETVFDKQEDGRDYYKGLAEGHQALWVSIRTGAKLEEIENSFGLLINQVRGRRTPTQQGTHHNWRAEHVILDFYDPNVSNDAAIEFLEQVIEMIRDRQ